MKGKRDRGWAITTEREREKRKREGEREER